MSLHLGHNGAVGRVLNLNGIVDRWQLATRKYDIDNGTAHRDNAASEWKVRVRAGLVCFRWRVSHPDFRYSANNAEGFGAGTLGYVRMQAGRHCA